MTATMTITDTDWTIASNTEAFAEDGTDRDEATERAELFYVWLINNASGRLPGWVYTDGTFSGPIRKDAVSIVMNLIVEAVDYAIAADLTA